MVSSATEREKVPQADLKLSLWTVAGAIAASVMATAIIGGASGILHIPQIESEVNVLRNSREVALDAAIKLTERVRSTELEVQSNNRRIEALEQRLQRVDDNLNRIKDEQRQIDAKQSNDLAALEGRSKDRNTEANGMVNALRADVNGLKDRQESTARVLGELRQNVYDLATRLRMPSGVQQQSSPTPDTPPRSFGPLPNYQLQPSTPGRSSQVPEQGFAKQ